MEGATPSLTGARLAQLSWSLSVKSRKCLIKTRQRRCLFQGKEMRGTPQPAPLQRPLSPPAPSQGAQGHLQGPLELHCPHPNSWHLPSTRHGESLVLLLAPRKPLPTAPAVLCQLTGKGRKKSPKHCSKLSKEINLPPHLLPGSFLQADISTSCRMTPAWREKGERLLPLGSSGREGFQYPKEPFWEGPFVTHCPGGRGVSVGGWGGSGSKPPPMAALALPQLGGAGEW